MTTFEIVAVLDKGNYRDYTEARAKRAPRLAQLLVGTVLLVVALTEVLPWHGSLLCLILAALLLLWFGLSSHLLASVRWRRRAAGEKLLPTTYRFADTEFTREHPDGTAKHCYREITQVLETEECFFLCGAQFGYILPKGCFTVGNAAAFRSFIAEQTGATIRTCSPQKNYRRRATAVLVAVVLAVGMVTATRGYTYLRRPVTIRNGEAACTLSLPRFLEETPSFGIEPHYVGNGITVSAEFFSHTQLQWKFDNTKFNKPLTLASYAAFEQQQQAVPEKGEWVSDENVENEVYMQYAQGAEYVCTVLHWTESGCWRLEFTCPGERQDTYYNRFDLWRRSATYTE